MEVDEGTPSGGAGAAAGAGVAAGNNTAAAHSTANSNLSISGQSSLPGSTPGTEILDTLDSIDSATANKKVMATNINIPLIQHDTSSTSETGTLNNDTYSNLFGRAYRQCSSARVATLTGQSTDCSLHSNMGTRCEISEGRVGEMACSSDDSIKDTFRGSRISVYRMQGGSPHCT